MFFDDHLFNFMIRRINILKLGRVKEKKKEAGKEGEKGRYRSTEQTSEC